jgi:hypothetical protein
VVYFAFVDDSYLTGSNMVKPNATGSCPSKIDVVHATGFQCDVFLFSGRLGVVLVVQQYFVDRPAMDDQQTTGYHALSRRPGIGAFRHAV